jgi:beta-glucosidase
MCPDPVPAFRDANRSIGERVSDLLARLTVTEKISQMRNACTAIPRLGIPAYDYWSEALHGVARNGRATVFPQAIGMAATWDRDLIRRAASAIADEARAKHHETMRKKGETTMYQGLTFWSPNVNIFRDPRWGRGQETWGEDPYLTGEMGSAFVHGLQGDDPNYMKTAACAKHYAVHSGPENKRHTFNAIVSKRELNETYLPAFKKLVQEAKVEAVMGAYNRTLDEPCNASFLLLDEYLRRRWGFNGHVVSDCGALTDIYAHHKVVNDGPEAAALALKAGCDIGCDSVYFDFLSEALERGLVTEADLDRALARTLATRFKLGLFDPTERVPYAATSMSVVGCETHRQLAYETAVKSVVLLKNKNNILPIQETNRNILVVGPTAGMVNVLLGNYYGLNDHMITFLEGITGRLPEGMRMEYLPGSLLAHPKRVENDWSVYSAGAADLVIAFMGLTPYFEGEEGEALLSNNGDRDDIQLPEVQKKYLIQLAQAGAKIVLVLSGGSPIALDGLEDIVDAIVFVWYPGQEGGRAVADVLFGDHAPSGRLPITFPKSVDQLPPFDDYSMADRTYRYASWEPLFPFGFGLSYTTFEYRQLSLAKAAITAGTALDFKVTLANTGAATGEEVVQVYLTDLAASAPVARHNLVEFRRVLLQPGEVREMSFTLSPDAMMFVGEDGEAYLEPGQFRLEVGGCAPGSRGQVLGTAHPVTVIFEVK